MTDSAAPESIVTLPRPAETNAPVRPTPLMTLSGMRYPTHQRRKNQGRDPRRSGLRCAAHLADPETESGR